MMYKKLLLLMFLIWSFVITGQVNYPLTRKEPIVNTYHSIEITNNYQW